MSFIYNTIARNLMKPETGLFGSITTRILKDRNAFLEEASPVLCAIEPGHHVLEVGFGPGLGMKKAAQYITKNEGMVHGIDFSPAMISEAMRTLSQEIEEGKVQLTLGDAARLPYGDVTMDRIFHTNCYYFWPDVTAVSRELYRVLKPGGFMVTLLNLSSVQAADEKGLLKYGKWEPEPYMDSLREVGFVNVALEEKEDDEGRKYEAMFAYKS